MLRPLDALNLFAPVVSVLPLTPRSPVSTDCPVAARSVGDTARSGGGEDRGCAGGQPALAAGVVAAGP